MIRMGRNSRTEQDNETDNQQTQTNYPYTSGNLPNETRAISESETMARDIKEGRLSGFVGSGTTLTGETNFQAMLRIDGHLTGKVSSDNGTLIVGTGGQVDANINVAEALISGRVNGDIVATEKLQLGRTARVVGNIQTPRLTMEDGAILEGGCSMLKAKESMEKRNMEETSGVSSSTVSDYEEAETEDEEETSSSYYSSTSYTETVTDDSDDDSDDEEETAEAATT